jgi:hypothetical protein
MLEFITRLFKKKDLDHFTDAGPTMLPMFDPNANLDRMNLDERRVWRQEMTHRALRDTMGDLGVISCMYRYKISRLDDRGHYYALMIDVTKDFTVSKHIDINGFNGIERKIIHDAFEKYGIVIKGVYWKTTDETIFEREKVGVRHMPPDDMFKKINIRAKLEAEFSDTMPLEYMPDTRAITRPKFEDMTAEAAEIFKAALREGKRPPPVKIGNQEYATDLAPLDLQ